jgi:hypothetical protein
MSTPGWSRRPIIIRDAFFESAEGRVLALTMDMMTQTETKTITI